MAKDTVSMYFVSAAVARLPGEVRDRLLHGVGIPADLLAVPQARVPAAAFAALWLAIARELDDEFFGLDARRMKVGSFALLCHAVIMSGNLDRALKHVLRGYGAFLDDIDGELHLENQQAVISLNNRIKDVYSRRFADETLLVMVHGLMCWLTGQRIPLTQVRFAHPRPPYAAEYTVMYSEHLSYDAPRTSASFDARLLRAPVIQTPAKLKEFLRSAPQSVFLKYKNQDSWSARLRRRLRDSIGKDWPLLEEVAREFHVAPTTLRRRLEAEGSSYQGIKDELRRDAAIDYLCHGSMSVAQIAGLLGFQEPSAFHRAFKKWNGVQPGEYRIRQGRVL